MAEPLANGVHIRRDFLSLSALLKLLGGLDRLSQRWESSEALGLLGRGKTTQIRAADIAVQAQIDEIGHAIAPGALLWARTCGFRLPAAPQIQLFPVRMVGDAETPICTNVFYARTQAIEGGDLLVAKSGSDFSDPIVVQPTTNTLVTFAGDRVHCIRPLYAGERLSVVLNFY